MIFIYFYDAINHPQNARLMIINDWDAHNNFFESQFWLLTLGIEPSLAGPLDLQTIFVWICVVFSYLKLENKHEHNTYTLWLI